MGFQFKPKLAAVLAVLNGVSVARAAVKALRGEWVSQGKNSYWWVPTTQEVEV